MHRVSLAAPLRIPRALALGVALALAAITRVAPSPASAQDRAAQLTSARESSQRAARELVNLDIDDLSLERERSLASADQALAITLYVGGIGGAIASVALSLGAILEGVCVDGDIDACMDGPSFVAAALPTAFVTTVLLFGATLYQRRVDARTAELEARGRDLEERRRQLEQELGLAMGPTSFTLRARF